MFKKRGSSRPEDSSEEMDMSPAFPKGFGGSLIVLLIIAVFAIAMVIAFWVSN